MNNPINRTTIQTASNKYKLYTKNAPCCYKKADGTYDHIDLTFNDATSTIGNISLLEKNIVSVGIRKDNNPHKYVGIRPDNNQANGTQQLEFSLINVELDGESQSFSCDDDYELRIKGSNIKQLVKVNKSFKDFKIEFDIHAKGLPIANEKYTKETVVRDYGFNIQNLGEIEAGNTEYTSDNIFTESKDIPYIDCRIFKITNDYITTGEYSIEEEFGDSDLSGYIINNDLYSDGSSVYYKDCIVLYAKCHNIENHVDVFLKNLCSIYGLEIFDDGGSGVYLTKNGKKVMGYFTKSQSEFLLFVNTKEIPDSIKSLFKRKTFDDTSYLDITLDSFKESLETNFDISLQLKVDSNYYKPIQNSFNFKLSNEYFYIHLPVLIDEEYNGIELETTHTLKYNGDGSYRYTKYFNTEGRLLNENNIKYIDTNLYVSSYPERPYFRLLSARGSTTLTSARNSTDGGIFGSALTNDSGDNVQIVCGDLATRTSSGQGASYSVNYYQGYYIFDSSGITSEVSALSWKHISVQHNTETSDTPGNLGIIALKADNTGNTGKDAYNDMTGHTSAWDASDVTEYSAEHVITENQTIITSVSWIKANTPNNGLHETTFNSDARADIESDDIFKFVMLDYDQYYSNSNVGDYGTTASNASGRRTLMTAETDNSVTADRPYLDVTTDTATAVTYNANFFGTNF